MANEAVDAVCALDTLDALGALDTLGAVDAVDARDDISARALFRMNQQMVQMLRENQALMHSLMRFVEGRTLIPPVAEAAAPPGPSQPDAVVAESAAGWDVQSAHVDFSNVLFACLLFSLIYLIRI